MQKVLRIGTRDSQLAVWQATLVQKLLKEQGADSELVFIKSEGDLDTITPLYAIGVTGVFTKTLDAALLNNRIDIAVHSMKDVPVQLAKGIQQAAVLPRASHKDIIVIKNDDSFIHDNNSTAVIATGSVRRIAQWINRYPQHKVESLRGNVNTRLRKLEENDWNGAIFAAAGLERIGLRPSNSIDLDWMLPAPAQGAIMIVCRESDQQSFESCNKLNDKSTEICVKVERDFLSELMGGCSTPISALAELEEDRVHIHGNILSPDGREKNEVKLSNSISDYELLGKKAAFEIIENGGENILRMIRNKGLMRNGEV